jgi:hypothetical protein
MTEIIAKFNLEYHINEINHQQHHTWTLALDSNIAYSHVKIEELCKRMSKLEWWNQDFQLHVTGLWNVYMLEYEICRDSKLQKLFN